MSIREGQRVRHRLTGEIGSVVGIKRHGGPVRYQTSFPAGVFEYAPHDLLPVYDDPFELLVSPPPSISPYAGWLRREGLRLLDAYRNDPTAALSNSRVEPQHHQVSVALRALDKPQARLIIADEVGLGKTIEAGLILKELRSRGVLDRVLVLTPASLTTQWQRELRSKFNEIFVLHDGAMLRDLRERHPDQNPWDVSERANVIASLQFARGERERARVADAHWDLVIVDEAHHARRNWNDGKQEANLGYQLLEEMRDRIGGLLLLTATPMQLHPAELYAMVELVEPGLFTDYADFEQKREEIAVINRHVGRLRVGAVSGPQQRELHDVLQEWGASNEILTADLNDGAARDEVCTWLESRHLLATALVRNRKAHVGGFTKRVAHRVPVVPGEDELELEADVQAYLRRQYVASPAFGLVLVTFQKLIASSSKALAGALERRAARLLDQHASEEAQVKELTDDPEIAEEIARLLTHQGIDVAAEVLELGELAERARAIEDRKLEALDQELEALFSEQPDQKVLIFSQYKDTIEMIRSRIASKLRVEVFHGDMDRREKDEAADAFRKHVQVLVSSEAGGEGRNFQFCHIVFNYDLPWNPMRIEQRIGRLDRVGQKHNVLIYNFGVQGTLDERILDVLEKRIQVFTESVGALEPILGDMEDRIKRICLADAITARREFDRYEVDLTERIRRARSKDQQLQDFVMDARSFRRDEVARLLEQEPKATPRDLERFLRAAFAQYSASPRSGVTNDGDGIVVFDVPGVLQQRDKSLRERYRGSFDYRVALADERLEFFAFGHPLVEAVVRSITEEGAVPPVTVLETDDGTAGAFLVDYDVRLQGVRDREELLTHVVETDVVVETSPVVLPPPDPQLMVPFAPIEGDRAKTLEGLSRAAAYAELEHRVADFREENSKALAAEQDRLEKRFSFQRRHFEQRIERVVSQVDRLERYGTESERGIIPALQGRIAADRRRLVELEEDRARELELLDARSAPAESIRVLAITQLVAAGTLGDEVGGGHAAI